MKYIKKIIICLIEFIMHVFGKKQKFLLSEDNTILLDEDGSYSEVEK